MSASLLSRLGKGIERQVGALSAFCFRRAPVVSVVLLLLTLGMASAARGLKISTDLTTLLPDSFESVRDVRRLSEEFGGVGYVSVIVRGQDQAHLAAFAEVAATRLAAVPTVRYVDYKRPVGFFRQRGLYYLDHADLEVVRDRLRARRDWEVSRATGAQLDEDETAPPVEFGDLEARYKRRLGIQEDAQRPRGDGEYYLSPDGTSLAMLVKPTKLASDFGFVKQVVKDVEDALAASDATGHGVTYELSGRYKKRVDLQATVSQDLSRASLAAFVLVLGYVALHFRRVLAVVLVFLPLTFAMAATYGMAALLIGSLNILTAFIGAILLGIALDNGIHLLGRYDEDRAAGMAPEEAIRGAFGEAGRASSAAVLTNVGAFLCLLIADFKAFREFGVLAAGGMLFTLVAYLTVLPALLGLSTRLLKPKPAPEAVPLRVKPWLRWAPAFFYGSLLVFVFAAARLPTVRFNYDFAVLDEADLPSFRLDKEVNHLIGRSQTPLVVLGKTEQEATSVAAQLRQRAEGLGQHSTIDRVLTLSDLVPADQASKKDVLDEIGEVARGLRDTLLDDKQRRRKDELVTMTTAAQFTRDDLPLEVKRQFQRPGSTELANFVLIYPAVSMSDGRKAQAVASEVRGMQLVDGRQLHAAGEPLVLADILSSVQREMPYVFALALLQQLVLLILIMGSFGRAALTIVPALVTIPLLGGFLTLFGLEFNYLNIILLPVLLGMGEDGGAHLVARVAAGEELGDALGHTARATFGAGLTTLFGFGAMVLSSHPALRMFGAVAVLGIALNLLVCIFFLPAMMAILDVGRRWRRSDGAVPS